MLSLSQTVPYIALSALFLCFHQSAADVRGCMGTVDGILLDIFKGLGDDCDAYTSLYTDTSTYYHQQDGFHTGADIRAVCEGYGGFCPPGECTFQQEGLPYVIVPLGSTNECYILAPYIWSQHPANNKVPDNMEPHVGFVYIAASPDGNAKHGYTIETFAEFDSTFSQHLNWANPRDTSIYNWTTDLLASSASNAMECNSPIAPLLTDFFEDKSNADGELWRQSNNAIVLAAGNGGICHVLVPYAAEVSRTLSSGYIIFILEPNEDGYNITSHLEFPSTSIKVSEVDTETTSAAPDLSVFSKLLLISTAATFVAAV